VDSGGYTSLQCHVRKDVVDSIDVHELMKEFVLLEAVGQTRLK